MSMTLGLFMQGHEQEALTVAQTHWCRKSYEVSLIAYGKHHPWTAILSNLTSPVFQEDPKDGWTSKAADDVATIVDIRYGRGDVCI